MTPLKQQQKSDNYVLILAGGSGTRFWPLSRDKKPKQLLNLFDNNTLLEQTLERLEGLIPKKNIIILTNKLQENSVRTVAKDIPSQNIFAEPTKRDTAPAIALGIGLIAARNPAATMAVLPSDHLIQDITSFQDVLKDSFTVASETDGLVTIGIKPHWACPSYGYIERGNPAQILSSIKNTPHEVSCFREKPDPQTAEAFLRQGNYTWNAGMFVWSIPTVTTELEKHTPELTSFIDMVRKSPEPNLVIEESFEALTPISIDYALMEKATRVLNIEATFDWDDIGSWISMSQYLKPYDNENVTNHEITEVDAQRNVVFSDDKKAHIALVGVEDLIIVQTEDALLIAHKDQADSIKKLGEKLPKELL